MSTLLSFMLFLILLLIFLFYLLFVLYSVDVGSLYFFMFTNFIFAVLMKNCWFIQSFRESAVSDRHVLFSSE